MHTASLTPLVVAVSGHGGVARTRVLEDEGFSRHHQARAIELGALTRPTRGWVALPSADPALVEAARAGVVLTCLTAARRLGLWVLDDAVVHVAAARTGHPRVDAARVHVHWASPVVPRHPDALVDPVENVLVILADCRPYEEALATWESALHDGLVTIEQLRRLPLGPRARRLAENATPWSDSGLESFVPPRLRFLNLPIVPQAWIAGHRVDFLIGERLVLQIDGGSHVGAQRERDIAHDALLMLMGYHVIRVGYGQVVDRWHEVQAMIMDAVAQGLHRAR